MTPPSPSSGTTSCCSPTALLTDLRNCINQRCGCCEECIRKSPGKAMIIAVGTGYVLSRLPLRSIIVSQIRLAAALAPPALLALGAVKLCEFLKSSSRPRAIKALENSGELPSLNL